MLPLSVSLIYRISLANFPPMNRGSRFKKKLRRSTHLVRDSRMLYWSMELSSGLRKGERRNTIWSYWKRFSGRKTQSKFVQIEHIKVHILSLLSECTGLMSFFSDLQIYTTVVVRSAVTGPTQAGFK